MVDKIIYDVIIFKYYSHNLVFCHMIIDNPSIWKKMGHHSEPIHDCEDNTKPFGRSNM